MRSNKTAVCKATALYFGLHGNGRKTSFVASRSETKFFFEPRFDKVIGSFGLSNYAKILDDISKFEMAWNNSKDDEALPKRYNFHPYKGVSRVYKIYQIYVGPNQNYRSVLLFYDGTNAYWIYAFKKEHDSEPQEVERAISRAIDYISKLKEKK